VSFCPLEGFCQEESGLQVWDEENPCRVLVKRL